MRIALVVVLVALVTLGVAAGVAYWVMKPDMSINEVKRDINASLPAGSTVQEITTYLDDHSFAHDGPEPAAPDVAARFAPNVREGQIVIEATAGTSTQWRWIDSVELLIAFALDENQQLEHVAFEEISSP